MREDSIDITQLKSLEQLKEHDKKKTLTISNDSDDRNNNGNQHYKAHKCVNCGTMSTPLWRRTQNGLITCNACGLYLKANKTHRPINLKKPPNLVSLSRIGNSSEFKGLNMCNHKEADIRCTSCQYRIRKYENNELNLSLGFYSSLDSDSNVVVVACFNCQSTVTPLWRRDPSGNTICNACGLYFKIHGISRPVKLKKNIIRRRARKKITSKIDYKINNRMDNKVSKMDDKFVKIVDEVGDRAADNKVDDITVDKVDDKVNSKVNDKVDVKVDFKVDDKINNEIYNGVDNIDHKIDSQVGTQFVNKNKNTKIRNKINDNVISIDVTGYKINKDSRDEVVERRKAIKLGELLN